jgi:hypothetical protein
MFERDEIDIDPDDDQLAAQLGSIKWGLDSKGRIKIESKDDMKKWGMRGSRASNACTTQPTSSTTTPTSNRHNRAAQGGHRTAAHGARAQPIRRRPTMTTHASPSIRAAPSPTGERAYGALRRAASTETAGGRMSADRNALPALALQATDLLLEASMNQPIYRNGEPAADRLILVGGRTRHKRGYWSRSLDKSRGFCDHSLHRRRIITRHHEIGIPSNRSRTRRAAGLDRLDASDGNVRVTNSWPTSPWLR